LADAAEIEDVPVPGAGFAPLPAAAADPRAHGRWRTLLVQHLQRNHPLELFRSSVPPLVSRPGESAGDFRIRAGTGSREQRDHDKEALRARYGVKLGRLRDRLLRAEQSVGRERAQFSDRTTQAAISVGTSLLGALFGRRRVSGAAAIARDVSRSAREHGDIDRAEDRAEAVRQELAAMEADLVRELAALEPAFAPADLAIETVQVPPRKADTSVQLLALVWCPWCEQPGSAPAPAYAGAAVDHSR
jgi:hypothetical protein